MEIAKTVEEFRKLRDELSGTLSFVPTLGALHHGHAALFQRGKTEADHLVVSIFLNPMQFGPNEDLDKYPTSFEQDVELCERNGVRILFAPERAELFPKDPEGGTLHTSVEVDRFNGRLCDLSRPGHFRGVTTIVAKLFNIVRPNIAYFGEKDYQQLAMIKQMIEDLSYPIEVRSLPVVRDTDGVAVSSRNQRLTKEERRVAPKIWEGLTAARRAYRVAGCHDPRELEAVVRRTISQADAFEIEYIECIDGKTLDRLQNEINPGERPSVLMVVAAKLGDVRLIDNLPLNTK